MRRGAATTGAAALGVKVAALARAWIARGELTAAAERIAAAETVPFAQTAAALVEVRAELASRRRALRLRALAPWLIAAALILLALLRRAI